MVVVGEMTQNISKIGRCQPFIFSGHGGGSSFISCLFSYQSVAVLTVILQAKYKLDF